MLNFTKEEQGTLGDNIVQLKNELDELFKKYNFEYDGNGQDLVNGSFDFFWDLKNE